MPEDLHAGVGQESRENEYHECQDYDEARVSLQEMLVLVVSRYLERRYSNEPSLSCLIASVRRMNKGNGP